MFPLDLPIVIQDGIIIALFASAAGFLLYKKLRKKSKSCPACAGDCAPPFTSSALPSQKPSRSSPPPNAN